MNTYILSAAVMTGVLTPALMILALWSRKRGSWRDDGAVRPWRLGLLNTGNGQYLQKEFFQTLDLGRNTGAEEPESMLFLSFDQTLSRRQCRIREIRNELWIENMSQVNGSILNGILLDAPRRLHTGDRLLLSRQEYLVCLMERG